jgi:DNA-binding NtrC family response regulator
MALDLKKVLIVDDEETLTWSMAKSLSKDKDKYEVLIANNGREALNLLKKSKVDLVISDIRMPDINGLDLLVRIKMEHPQTKVIIMTAYGSSDVQKEANRRGSLYYIEKPFEISDIRKIIIDPGKKKGFKGKVFDVQLTDIIRNELPRTPDPAW